MKLVVAGATGLVGTEVVRQALRNPQITAVVALNRRAMEVPEGIDSPAESAKFKSVIMDDWAVYPDAVKQALAGVDACIWTIAVTPAKMKDMPFEEIEKICLDYTVAGLDAIFAARQVSAANPLRFVYISGIHATRDQNAELSMPPPIARYSKMRGEVENRVLAFAAQHPGRLEACVVKPGAIDGPGRADEVQKSIQAAAAAGVTLPQVDVTEIAATMLAQVTEGVGKDTLLNDELVTMGRAILGAGS